MADLKKTTAWPDREAIHSAGGLVHPTCEPEAPSAAVAAALLCPGSAPKSVSSVRIGTSHFQVESTGQRLPASGVGNLLRMG